MPPHLVTLQTVLSTEIGGAKDGIPDYLCTAGAHRGSSMMYLENSLDALAAAGRDPQFAFVEFDVQYTRDGRIVAFHDKTLLRLFGSLKKIGSSDYDVLASITEGNIALYSDAMSVLGDKRVNIEIKSQGDEMEDRRLADEIVADITARNRVKDVMISSISGRVIRYVKTTYPGIRTGQIYWLTASTYLHLDRLTSGLYRRFESTQADYLMMHVANLRNIEALLRLKPDNKTVVFWDFDDRMYLVHKDVGDRLWGESVFSAWFRPVRRIFLKPRD